MARNLCCDSYHVHNMTYLLYYRNYIRVKYVTWDISWGRCSLIGLLVMSVVVVFVLLLLFSGAWGGGVPVQLLFVVSSSSLVGPITNATDVLQPSRLIVLTLSPPPTRMFGHSHIRRQVPPHPQRRKRSLKRKVELYGRELASNFAWNCDFVNSGIFYMPQICDMGPMLYFPSEGRHAEDFFHPEKSWQLWPGLNPWTWVLKGSTLPLDHRSRFVVCHSFLFLIGCVLSNSAIMKSDLLCSVITVWVLQCV